MPHCQNCGSHVTSDYTRVFTPSGVDDPRVCPGCPDKIRDNGQIREARSTRHNSKKAGGDA